METYGVFSGSPVLLNFVTYRYIYSLDVRKILRRYLTSILGFFTYLGLARRGIKNCLVALMRPVYLGIFDGFWE